MQQAAPPISIYFNDRIAPQRSESNRVRPTGISTRTTAGQFKLFISCISHISTNANTIPLGLTA